MAKDEGVIQTSLRPRTPVRVPADAPEKRRIDLVRFFREVRAEARKVTWTSWRETWITSVMVAIMVVTAAIFFWAVDLGVSFSINQILKLSAGS